MFASKLRRFLEPFRKNGVLDVATAVALGRVESVDRGIPVTWLISNRNDEIQRHQLTDGFYELAELEQLHADIGPQRVVLDIGANIGNHAVFFSKRMGCERVILVEPYPPAIRHLLVNLSLNYRQCFDLSFLGRGIGKRSGTARIIPPTEFNLGLTKLDASEPGETQLISGDELLLDSPIDLIKIDVEGMEIDVIEGLEATLTKQRPSLYVEVSHDNRDRFLKLIERHGYSVRRETQAYASQSNFTAVPKVGSS